MQGVKLLGNQQGLNLSATDFTHAMIALGVSAAVILALGITLKLLGRLLEVNIGATLVVALLVLTSQERGALSRSASQPTSQPAYRQ